MSTILSYTDYIDWKTFIADKLGEDLRDRYRAVKTVAPETIVTSHAASRGALRVAESLGRAVGRLDDGAAGGLSTARRSTRSTRRSSIATCCGAGRCSISRGRSVRRRPPRILCRRAAGGLRHDRAERQPDGDAGGPARLDVERARARREGRQFLRVLSDELGLRERRLRPHPVGRDDHRSGARGGRGRAGGRPESEAVPRREAGRRAGGDGVQSDGALRRRTAARGGVRRPAGRGRGHRARLAARRVSRAVSAQRARRLRSHRTSSRRTCCGRTNSSSCRIR